MDNRLLLYNMVEELTLFKALADPTRLRILVLLAEKELCVCHLEWALGMSQAKVSRHLNVLRNAGLVQYRREGLWVFYSLAKPKNKLEKSIHRYLKEYFAEKFANDLVKMKECVSKPLNKLKTIKQGVLWGK